MQQMSEIRIQLLICGGIEEMENLELRFPIVFLHMANMSSLHRHLGLKKKRDHPDNVRYVILLLEKSDIDADVYYNEMEENPSVMVVIHRWDEVELPPSSLTKLLYVPTELLTLVVTFSAIQLLKIEADNEGQSGGVALAKTYLREAKVLKEWLMSTMRAIPCHVLIIPLNTNQKNVLNVQKYLQKTCAQLGYPSAMICSLDDYIPKGEIYNKLPYGKYLFENEHPTIICRWLRELSPIRLYLYGNEGTIRYEWSKTMIAGEMEQSMFGIANDDDWHTFFEYEPVREDIKWNFAAKHGQDWQVKQFVPLLAKSFGENIRFRSALRRAHQTLETRMTTVSSKIFDAIDKAFQMGYISNEFTLTRQDQLNPLQSGQRNKNNLSQSVNNDGKDHDLYTLPYSSNYSLEISHNFARNSHQMFIWIDPKLFAIEERFKSLISPNPWNYFSDIQSCYSILFNEQIQWNRKLTIIASFSMAREILSYENIIPNIFTVYVYFDHSEQAWIDQLSPSKTLRGVYSELDSLYNKFETDVKASGHFILEEQEEIHYNLPFIFANEESQITQNLQDFLSVFKGKNYRFNDDQRTLTEFTQLLRKKQVPPIEIDEFIENYEPDQVVKWYTRSYHFHRILNQALVERNTNFLWACRPLIGDLYIQLKNLQTQYFQSFEYLNERPLQLYRGQKISLEDMDRLKQGIGSVVMTRSFLSTSKSFDIALMFADHSQNHEFKSFYSVIFSIVVDLAKRNTAPYAPIDYLSVFKEEEEVLFAPGCHFRIINVDRLSINDDIQVISLELMNEDEVESNQLLFDPDRHQWKNLFSNSISVFIGLDFLFERESYGNELQSILRKADTEFFNTTDEFYNYRSSLYENQAYLIFFRRGLSLLEQDERMHMIPVNEDEMHLNDLIYQFFDDADITLYDQLKKVYCPSDEDFYVHLIDIEESKADVEQRLRSKLPSTTFVTFYQVRTCLTFLRSISDSNQLGNAILILRSDKSNIDEILNECEAINAIKSIYLCSPEASSINYRTILHEKFLTENALFMRLINDHLFFTLRKAHDQSLIHHNRDEAKQYLQRSQVFYDLLSEEGPIELKKTLND